MQFKLEKLFGVVLFYFLILLDKLELVLIMVDGKMVYEIVEVKGKEVEWAIVDFCCIIFNFIVNVKKFFEKFYNWLIKLIENELIKVKINIIIYVLDK